jgi:hypothetical protein
VVVAVVEGGARARFSGWFSFEDDIVEDVATCGDDNEEDDGMVSMVTLKFSVTAVDEASRPRFRPFFVVADDDNDEIPL